MGHWFKSDCRYVLFFHRQNSIKNQVKIIMFLASVFPDGGIAGELKTTCGNKKTTIWLFFDFAFFATLSNYGGQIAEILRS